LYSLFVLEDDGL